MITFKLFLKQCMQSKEVWVSLLIIIVLGIYIGYVYLKYDNLF